MYLIKQAEDGKSFTIVRDDNVTRTYSSCYPQSDSKDIICYEAVRSDDAMFSIGLFVLVAVGFVFGVVCGYTSR